jgi:Amt family ammonium transporter
MFCTHYTCSLGLSDSNNITSSWHIFWYQFTKCAAACTIATTALAQRTKVTVYLIFTLFFACFIYAVPVSIALGLGQVFAFV